MSETAVHVCIESGDGGEEVHTLSVDVAVVVTTGEVHHHHLVGDVVRASSDDDPYIYPEEALAEVGYDIL